jgi:hypothetical protein
MEHLGRYAGTGFGNKNIWIASSRADNALSLTNDEPRFAYTPRMTQLPPVLTADFIGGGWKCQMELEAT